MERGGSFTSSPRDNTEVTVEGKPIDPEKLTPIPQPKITSREVPKNLPSFSRKTPSRIVSTPAKEKVSSRTSPSRQIKITSAPSNKQVSRQIRVISSNKVKSKPSSYVPGAGIYPHVKSSNARSPIHSPAQLLTPRDEYIEEEEPLRQVRVIRAVPRGYLHMPQIPDYSVLTDVQKEALRAKYDSKLVILRRRDSTLKPFGPNEPLEVIHVKYEQYWHQACVDKAVSKYKLYMTIIFLIIEALGTRIFHIPIAGYTKDQLKHIIFYEQLLMELAEKSSYGGGEDWPVEIRIFVLMAVQAVTFVIIKYLCGMLPEHVAEGIRGYINDLVLGTGGSKPVYDEHGIPEPPKETFDATNLLASLTGLFGGKPAATNNVDLSNNVVPFN